jgi:uncharacterized protein involved in outer membrane biogenesis
MERRTSGERVLPAGTASGERLLPNGALEGGRIKAIDADAELSAKRVKAPESLDVSNLRVVLHLKDALLKLDPFDLDFAGGRVLSSIDIDARQPTLAARTNVRLQQLKLADLLPKSPRLARSEGLIDGRIMLSGTGNSVADIAAKSEGQVIASVSHGEISNLLDAAAGLNGGKVIALLAGGDKNIPVRCGATVFSVHQGQGRSTLLLVDTAQTRIEGAGGFDLAQEQFDVTIAPKPKRPGILSLRTPVRLHGSFRNPEFELDKKGLALRGGAALVLGAVAPLAALVPLIESGPGGDVDCSRLTEVALWNDAKKGRSNDTRASPK